MHPSNAGDLPEETSVQSARRRGRRGFVTPLLWFAVVIVPYAVLGRASHPYLYILGMLFLASVATCVRHERGRPAMLALAGMTFALFLLEALVGFQLVGFTKPMPAVVDDAATAANPPRETFRIEGDYATPSNYFRDDSLLGYGPRKGVRVTARKFFGDDLIYDVVYTVGADGLRVVPFDASGATESLAFFGDSFTYGEGVNDGQSFPALVQKAVAHGFRVFNFAFHGYGPHQMLRRIDSGSALEIMGGKPPKHVFYLAIPEHMVRAMNGSSWDTQGPRYVLGRDWGLRFAGSFSNHIWAWLHHELMLSQLYSLAAISIVDRHPPDVLTEGMPLFTAIVDQTRQIVEKQWHARFHVLTWCRPGENCFWMEYRLRELGIDLTPLREVLPDFNTSYDRYVLRHDKHPSVYAHEQIADLIVRTWLHPAAAAGAPK